MKKLIIVLIALMIVNLVVVSVLHFNDNRKNENGVITYGVQKNCETKSLDELLKGDLK